jgi:signal transduction histidine kinase
MRISIVILLSVLSLTGIAVGFYLSDLNNSYQENEVESISKSLKEIHNGIQRETELIKNSSVDWSKLNNVFFLLSGDKVLSWSRNDFTLNFIDLPESKEFNLLQTNAGDFLVNKIAIEEGRQLVSVILLSRRYPISNQYLSPGLNKEIFKRLEGVVRPIESNLGYSINFEGNPKFRFEITSVKNTSYSNLIIFVVGLSAVFCILLAFELLKPLHRNKKYEYFFLGLSVIVIGIRLTLTNIGYPGRWTSSNVFSPQYFASSSYNASVGDLFINSLIILCVISYIFFTYPKWKLTKWLLSTKTLTKNLISIFILCASYFVLVYPFLFVETIFHNSAINLDITESIMVSGLRALAWLSILCGGLSAFLLLHLFINLSKALCKNRRLFIAFNIVGALLFLLYFIGAERDYWITLPIGFVLLLILFYSHLTSSLKRFQFNTFLYFLVVISAFGIQHSLSVKRFVEERKSLSHYRFASNYLMGHDLLGEFLLNEASSRISKDPLLLNSFITPFINKSTVRQKIKQIYLNPYFDRYEIQILLFNSTGEPLDNSGSLNFKELKSQISRNSNKTDYRNIYLLRPGNDVSSKQYVVIIELERDDQAVGYIVVNLSLKRIVPYSVYPELLVDNRFAQYLEIKDKSYAFINSDKIVSSFGDFNYDQKFDRSLLSEGKLYDEGINSDGFYHTAVEGDSDQTVIITSRSYPVFNVLTNFSFFFVSAILILVLGLIASLLITPIVGTKLSYATRIQLFIYLSFSIPLVIVVITTLNRLSRSTEEQLNSDFQLKTRQVAESVNGALNSYLNEGESRSYLEEKLIDHAKISNMDLTLYDNTGKYITSSQPLIVENQLTSNLINRSVYESILNKHDNTLVVNENIGSLQFNDCYQGLRSSDSGELIGILSAPYFQSASSLENARIGVLSSFLTIFTIVFVLFSIVSFYLVNWLTFPLRFITKVLGKTTLSGTNKPLEWESSDEIGLMVKEYNKMVINLEQSKNELARVQKESAWREIAKQVAHEIKNPLTPMKLTLQQMEHQLLNNKLDNERIKNSVNTMLNQVEILNEIATSFSAFAKMPLPHSDKISITKLILRCVDLYSNIEHGEVKFEGSFEDSFVLGDEQLLNRIFSNIILNALQSRNGGFVTVSIVLENQNGYVLITIKDDGAGIDPQLTNQIFIPHFSTKKTGSGLGLAIVKQGIEQSGGEIWFESKPEEGTTFYIKLPRVN